VPVRCKDGQRRSLLASDGSSGRRFSCASRRRGALLAKPALRISRLSISPRSLLGAGLESRRLALGVRLRFFSRARAPCLCLPAAVLLQLVDELQARSERGTQCEQQARGADSELEQRTTTTAGGQMKVAGGLSCLISMLDAERVRDSEQKSAQRQEREKEWVKAMETEEERERIRNSFPASSTASSGPCSCAPCFLNKINAKNIQTLPCKSKR
jgi:hypothetical protein